MGWQSVRALAVLLTGSVMTISVLVLASCNQRQ